MRKAFSLIEMMIVLMIIVIVGGISLFVFQSANQKKGLERSTEEARYLIIEAHSAAVTPPDDLSSLDSIRVVVDKTNRKITSQAWTTTAKIKDLRSVSVDVESISFDVLQYNATTPCVNTNSAHTSCYLVFYAVPATAGTVGLPAGQPKFCFINNAAAGNTAERIKKCIYVNRTTGLVELKNT